MVKKLFAAAAALAMTAAPTVAAAQSAPAPAPAPERIEGSGFTLDRDLLPFFALLAAVLLLVLAYGDGDEPASP